MTRIPEGRCQSRLFSTAIAPYISYLAIHIFLWKYETKQASETSIFILFPRLSVTYELIYNLLYPPLIFGNSVAGRAHRVWNNLLTNPFLLRQHLYDEVDQLNLHHDMQNLTKSGIIRWIHEYIHYQYYQYVACRLYIAVPFLYTAHQLGVYVDISRMFTVSKQGTLCGMKLFIHSQTSTLQPLKFGNG